MNDSRFDFNGRFPVLEFLERGPAGASRPVSRAVRLGRRLGEGSTGIVVKGLLEPGGLERPVAVKIMRRELAGTPTARRFEREAELLCTLSHPGLVRGIGCGSVCMGEDGAPPLPFLVMERVDGPSLAQELESGRHADDALFALNVTIGVASVLGYLHLDGRILAHRDIKPANILLAGGTVPKLIDLGVAKAILPYGPHARGRGAGPSTQLTGTLAYMAPEQAADSSRVDTRSDIFSLGLVLGELLGCRTGCPDPPGRVIREIPQLDRSDARRLGIDFRTMSRLNSLLSMACAWNPENRFQSPSDLCRELSDVASSLQTSSATDMPDSKSSMAPRRPIPHRGPQGRRWGRNTKGACAAGAASPRSKRFRITTTCLAAAGALALWLAMSALSGLPGPFASPESGHRPQPPVGREIVVEPGPDDSASQASPARHGA